MSKISVGVVAKILIVNGRNQLLVLTLGEHGLCPDKSYTPDLPGGIVERGEAELDAVVRESYEETGIELSRKDIQLVYTETEFIRHEQKSIVKLLYAVRLGSAPEVSLSWEHASYEWVDIDKVMSAVEFRPFYKKGFEYCAEHKLLGLC